MSQLFLFLKLIIIIIHTQPPPPQITHYYIQISPQKNYSRDFIAYNYIYQFMQTSSPIKNVLFARFFPAEFEIWPFANRPKKSSDFWVGKNFNNKIIFTCFAENYGQFSNLGPFFRTRFEYLAILNSRTLSKKSSDIIIIIIIIIIIRSIANEKNYYSNLARPKNRLVFKMLSIKSLIKRYNL